MTRQLKEGLSPVVSQAFISPVCYLVFRPDTDISRWRMRFANRVLINTEIADLLWEEGVYATGKKVSQKFKENLPIIFDEYLPHMLLF